MVQVVPKGRTAAISFVFTVGRLVRLAWEAYPSGLVAILILDLLQGLIPLGIAWVTKLLFDQLALVLRTGAPNAPPVAAAPLPETIFLILSVQVVFVILTQALAPVAGYFNAQLGRKISLNVQVNALQKINSLSGLAYFEDPQFYDTIELAARGAQRGPSQAVVTLTSILRGALTIFAFLGVLLSLSPILAAAIFLSSLPHLYLHIKAGHQRLVTALETSPKERRVTYYNNLLAGLPYAKEMRLFGLADHFLRLFRQATGEIHLLRRQQHARELRANLALTVLANVVNGLAFGAVVFFVLENRLTLGDVMLYTSAVASMQTALSSLVFGLGNIHESVLFYSHYRKLMELGEPLAASTRTLPVPQLRSGIEIRNVSFRYGDEHPWVLYNANLFIPAGRSVALVGLNGAGKTTLVKLLTRLYDPTEGAILWDGIDLREFDPQELRRHTAAILQDFVHYDLSAQQNIGLGDLSKLEDNDSIQLAATKAGIHDKIGELPHGYETVLSRWLTDKGTGADLSGGEWQKVAVARMFMRDGTADLLIMDEPTAALDAKAEYEIYSKFVELMSGRTCLLITHRFSTVHMSNLVAVLENGQITEYGTHDELLAYNKTYAQLYNMQATHYR
ncbi:MAG: ABC transporter ATP-binding protein/permease [Chloroflexota bacterium]|nr:ABC transporter ATP-binding protein/permease [Chloroflexota bacterium]